MINKFIYFLVLVFIKHIPYICAWHQELLINLNWNNRLQNKTGQTLERCITEEIHTTKNVSTCIEPTRLPSANESSFSAPTFALRRSVCLLYNKRLHIKINPYNPFNWLRRISKRINWHSFRDLIAFQKLDLCKCS